MEIKVTQLEMTMIKTNAVLEKGKHQATERHLSTLKHLSSEVNRMRLDVEAAKLVAKWDELSEVLLDVETKENRRPLSYVEEDLGLPILFVPALPPAPEQPA